MAQAAKAQEPTMEEILASIRRIIADDDGSKAKPAEPPSKPALAAAPPPAPKTAAPPPSAKDASAMSQADIDAMLSGADAGMEPAEPSQDAEPPDVFELTEAMTAPAVATAEPPAFKKIDPSPDVFFSEEPQPSPPAARPAPLVETPALLSASATAAVDAAFNSLAHTVLVQNAKTLEDLVKEMLRPMLKSWLDDNLPTLVERLVRTEIERVSRGRQG